MAQPASGTSPTVAERNLNHRCLRNASPRPPGPVSGLRALCDLWGAELTPSTGHQPLSCTVLWREVQPCGPAAPRPSVASRWGRGGGGASKWRQLTPVSVASVKGLQSGWEPENVIEQPAA